MRLAAGGTSPRGDGGSKGVERTTGEGWGRTRRRGGHCGLPCKPIGCSLSKQGDPHRTSHHLSVPAHSDPKPQRLVSRQVAKVVSWCRSAMVRVATDGARACFTIASNAALRRDSPPYLRRSPVLIIDSRAMQQRHVHFNISTIRIRLYARVYVRVCTQIMFETQSISAHAAVPVSAKSFKIYSPSVPSSGRRSPLEHTQNRLRGPSKPHHAEDTNRSH